VEFEKQQAMQGVLAGNPFKEFSAHPCAAAREKAQTIAENQVKLYQREFAAWSWLRRAMDQLPLNTEEEAALWELLCRARRERY
jgi:hypothetical protein